MGLFQKLNTTANLEHQFDLDPASDPTIEVNSILSTSGEAIGTDLESRTLGHGDGLFIPPRISRHGIGLPRSPSPPQDGIFMAIFYPYPQHANMEAEEDVERVARWLGSIVRPACLEAFYHNPSVSTIIRLLDDNFSPFSPLGGYTRTYMLHFGAHVHGLSYGWHIVRIVWNVRY